MYRVDGFFYVMMGPVDMFQGAMLETLSKCVVLFLGNVAMGFVDQFEGAVKTAGPIHVRVDRRMIIKVLAVVDGSLLDLIDGVIDIVNGFPFLLTQLSAVRALQMRPGVA